MAKPLYRAGDLFAVPFPDGTYATARVLLDVAAQCFASRKVDDTSALTAFRGWILVEVYREVSAAPSGLVSPVVIPGMFADPDLIGGSGKRRWKITGHVDVSPVAVAFPEGLLQTPDGRLCFLSGEIKQVLNVDAKHLDRYTTRVSLGSAARFVNICAYYTGRKELLGEHVEAFSLASADLRFTADRDEIYRFMREDPARPYYERAKARGFDLARFYS